MDTTLDDSAYDIDEFAIGSSGEEDMIVKDDYEEYIRDLQESNSRHVEDIVVFAVLIFLSAPGNNYVVYSTMRKLRGFGHKVVYQKWMNTFCLHLAVAHIFITLIMIPIEIGMHATVSWRAGDIACRLILYFRPFGLYLVGFVLASFFANIYLQVVKGTTDSDSWNRSKILLIFAWILAAFCSLPQSFIFHVESHPVFPSLELCVPLNAFTFLKFGRAYNIIAICFVYVLPMVAIMYICLCILCKLGSTTVVGGHEQCAEGDSRQITHETRKNLLKLIMLTSISFGFCWTPYNIHCLWLVIYPTFIGDPRLHDRLYLFGCSNSCLYPVIYWWYAEVVGLGRNNRRCSSGTDFE